MGNKPSMQDTLNVTTLNGVSYYTVEQFAALTGKTTSNVFMLIRIGNRIRKLQTIRIGRAVFIPVSEYTEYVFTHVGVDRRTYMYDTQGKRVYTY